MAKGKLIILEAGDGSGKATQTKALFDRLKSEGHRVHRISFPDYEAESSGPVRHASQRCQCLCGIDVFCR